MFKDYKEIKDRNMAILAMMVQMAEADNDLDLAEQEFILEVAYQINLNGEEVEEIFTTPEKFVLKPPKNEEDRMTILYYILFMMRLDGKILPKEEEMAYKAGLRLGFNHDMVTDMIQVMKNYLLEELPEDALLNIIRKYLN